MAGQNKPENQKRERREGRYKVRAIKKENPRRAKPYCRERSVECVHWASVGPDSSPRPAKSPSLQE